MAKEHISGKCDVIKPGPDMPYELAFDGARAARSDEQKRRYGIVNGEVNDADWLKRRCRRARQLSRKQLVQSVADAYAAYCLVTIDPSLTSMVLAVAKHERVKRNSRTTILRLLVELHVSYGEGGTEPEDVARAQNNYSRDEKAIEHLIARNIPPCGVVALSQEKNEGLDKWFRGERPKKRVTKSCKSAKSPYDDVMKEITNRVPGDYKVTWATPSGKKFTIVVDEKIAEAASPMIAILINSQKLKKKKSEGFISYLKPQRSPRQ